MLDIIQTTGAPKTRQYFLVYEKNLQEFIGMDGHYNQHKMLIVAAANYGPSGNLFDWAAYTGLTSFPYSDAQVQEAIASHGNKLTVGECKFYLRGQPGLTGLLKRYRE